MCWRNCMPRPGGRRSASGLCGCVEVVDVDPVEALRAVARELGLDRVAHQRLLAGAARAHHEQVMAAARHRDAELDRRAGALLADDARATVARPPPRRRCRARRRRSAGPVRSARAGGRAWGSTEGHSRGGVARLPVARWSRLSEVKQVLTAKSAPCPLRTVPWPPCCRWPCSPPAPHARPTCARGRRPERSTRRWSCDALYDEADRVRQRAARPGLRGRRALGQQHHRPRPGRHACSGRRCWRCARPGPMPRHWRS